MSEKTKNLFGLPLKEDLNAASRLDLGRAITDRRPLSKIKIKTKNHSIPENMYWLNRMDRIVNLDSRESPKKTDLFDQRKLEDKKTKMDPRRKSQGSSRKSS